MMSILSVMLMWLLLAKANLRPLLCILHLTIRWQGVVADTETIKTFWHRFRQTNKYSF